MNVKLSDAVLQHQNVDVRLAAQYLQKAVAHARKGQVQDMLTAIRLAENFGSLVNPFNENQSKEIA